MKFRLFLTWLRAQVALSWGPRYLVEIQDTNEDFRFFLRWRALNFAQRAAQQRNGVVLVDLYVHDSSIYWVHGERWSSSGSFAL